MGLSAKLDAIIDGESMKNILTRAYILFLFNTLHFTIMIWFSNDQSQRPFYKNEFLYCIYAISKLHVLQNCHLFNKMLQIYYLFYPVNTSYSLQNKILEFHSEHIYANVYYYCELTAFIRGLITIRRHLP